MQTSDKAALSLPALEAEVARQLAMLAYPVRPWVPPRPGPDGAPVLDVVIVGAGQAGLATAFALKRECVDNILALDRAPAGREGPWLNYARMHTLRTPKHLIGPDLGVPALTPRAWYEAIHGAEGWARLGKLPREDWAAYLAWFRRVLDLPVRNGVTLTGIGPADGDLLALAVEAGGRPGRILARKLVLATGMEGGGGLVVPDFMDPALPRARWDHAMGPIDFAALAGRRVGVLGHGAGAFDNAGTALEAGAGHVDLFFRRPRIPRINPHRWMENAGFLRHYAEMPDALRWRFLRHVDLVDQPPPADAFARARRFANFTVHAGTPWSRVTAEGDGVRVETPRGAHHFDHVILATGVAMDPASRPELAPFADGILRWQDRFTPPPDQAHPALGRYPYLGPHYELQPRQPGTLPWLRHVHYFTYGAGLSMGVGGASLSGLRFSVARVVEGVTRGLYLESVETLYDQLVGFAEPETDLPDDMEG